MLLDGLEGLGGEAKLNETVAGLPPQLLVLQVHELLFLGLVVGEGHLVGTVRLLVREGTDPARDDGLELLLLLGEDGAGGGEETPRLRPASCEVAKPREEAELALRAAGVEKEELSSVVVVAMALRLG